MRTVRKTYPQDWHAYNAAQVNEKAKFLDLLRDLCGGVAEPERQRNGWPPLPINDALFAACFKIYSTVSGRRFMTDLREAQAKGYIAKVPHYNSIFNYLENPALTPILRALITESSPRSMRLSVILPPTVPASRLRAFIAGTITSMAWRARNTTG